MKSDQELETPLGSNNSLSQSASQQDSLVGLVESLQRKLSQLEAKFDKSFSENNPTAENPAVPAVTTKEPPTRKENPTRRRLLKGLAWGALVGVSATSLALVETQPTQAMVTVNPGSYPNVGAICNTGGTISGSVPKSDFYGVIGNSEVTLNLSTVGNNSMASISGYQIGVAGISQGNAGMGVYGESVSGPGVLGVSYNAEGVNGTSVAHYGVLGSTSNAGKAGVVATNTQSSGIALQIDQGSFKVTGAGVGTATTAFIHHTTSANVSSNITQIDNPFTNNKPGSLLFVTHNYNPPGTPGTYEIYQYGVFYLTTTQRWCIYHENINMHMPVDLYFNILVIVP